MIGLLFSLSSCYSFKTTSISPDINSFFVQNFNVSALAAPPNININFTTSLQDKIERETRLKYREGDPDIILSGTVADFSVTSQGASADATVSFDRLTIVVNVNYQNAREEDRDWEQRFEAFADYDASENLLDVQDALIEDIFSQITENVVNRAFSDW